MLKTNKNIINIIIPDLPESVSDATIVAWHKKIGEKVKIGDVLLEIETDKVILEIPSSKKGVLDVILKKNGSIVKSKQIVGYLKKEIDKQPDYYFKNEKELTNDHYLSPSLRRYISQNNSDIKKNKSLDTINNNKKKINKKNNNLQINKKIEKTPMSNIRKIIAQKLLYSKNNTVSLTTFNEVNMQAILDLKKKYNDFFEKKYNINLGIMSFYIKTVIKALEAYPIINAYIKNNDIIYYKYFDISIAIATKRGLITPVLRSVDKLNIVEIEKKIKELKKKGDDGKIKIEELTGGNFTISNSGVFGSLFSTPIINPPQSAILGINVIKKRPIVLENIITAVPMVYLALSYDHRIIDGQESIGFLNKIKEILENPFYLLIDI